MAYPVIRRRVQPGDGRLAARYGALARLCLPVWLLLVLAGCGGRHIGDSALLELTEEELFQTGKQAMDEGNRDRAREYLRRYEVRYPRGEHIEEAKFIVADTFYQDRVLEEKVEGVALFRSFLTFYPRHPLACEAQFKIAEYFAKRMRSPERDQTETRQAINEAQKLLATYLECGRRADAEALLASTMDRLAESEYAVAKYSLKTRNARGAAQRLEALLDGFPEYTHRPKAYKAWIKALEKLGETEEAKRVYDRMVAEEADSEHAREAREELGLDK